MSDDAEVMIKIRSYKQGQQGDAGSLVILDIDFPS